MVTTEAPTSFQSSLGRPLLQFGLAVGRGALQALEALPELSHGIAGHQQALGSRLVSKGNPNRKAVVWRGPLRTPTSTCTLDFWQLCNPLKVTASFAD